jgi:hypothetical protein
MTAERIFREKWRNVDGWGGDRLWSLYMRRREYRLAGEPGGCTPLQTSLSVLARRER